MLVDPLKQAGVGGGSSKSQTHIPGTIFKTLHFLRNV